LPQRWPGVVVGAGGNPTVIVPEATLWQAGWKTMSSKEKSLPYKMVFWFTNVSVA
jgi:hypothetical protein